MIRGFSMTAGDLRTLIAIHSKTVTGTGGFKTTSYAKTLDAWCNWVWSHGTEAVEGGAKQAARTATVTMRHSSLVVESSRVIMGGTTFEIVSPIENVQQRNEWLVFTVQAVVAG